MVSDGEDVIQAFDRIPPLRFGIHVEGKDRQKGTTMVL